MTYFFVAPQQELPPYFLMGAVVIIAFVSNKVALNRFFSTYKSLSHKKEI